MGGRRPFEGGRALCLLPWAMMLLSAVLLPTGTTQGTTDSRPSTAPPSSSPAPRKLAAIALSIKSRAIQDGRCYLMNGGAVESFFISEDTPVGSVVGTLSVNGDPSERGDITLRVQEPSAALGLAPGTKNVTLLRALDREERIGPSNIYVNVRCDRRRTSDPSFIIPVSVRVWDVNDNAPVWVGAPYTVRLSELTAVGSRVLPAARAVDADQPGPHATVHYSVLPGPHSEYFGFENELDGTLVVRKPLDYESQREMSLTLRATDAGRPPRHSDAALRVELIDADDQNPRFDHDHYTAQVPDNATEGTEVVPSPGPIRAADQDKGLNAPVYYSTATGSAVTVEKDSGRVFLAAGAQLPSTVVIKATQYDNPDRYALATLAISRRGTGEIGDGGGVRFTQKSFFVAVREDVAPGAVLLTLATQRGVPPGQQLLPLQFFVSDRSFLQQFAIDASGRLLLRRQLDHEDKDEFHYQVMVTDGRENDTASLNITVLNVNEWEPRFKHAHYEFSVDEGGDEGGAGGGGGEGGNGGAGGGGLLRVGRLEVFDGDKGDDVSLSLRGPDASLFYINEEGEVFLRRAALGAPGAPAALTAGPVALTAVARDSGNPPKQASVPVIVHVGERLLSAGVKGGGGGALAACAAALAMLALMVLALLAYICRNKRLKAHNKPSPTFAQPEKAPPPSRGPPSPLAAPLPPSGSLLSVSAGASTILANSSSSLDLRDSLPHNNNTTAMNRQSHRFPTKSRIAPLPPSPPPQSGDGGGGLALMSDHLAGAGGRSGVAWPSATIPTRVKKLSWDDAETDKGGGESVTEPHEATNPTMQEHMNLTVYF